MTGWFDLYDWPISVGCQDDPVGLSSSVKQIRAEIRKLIKEDGISPSKIVVGGFSQGGAVALLSCYHYDDDQFGSDDPPFPLAGCVGLSAWLTIPDDVVVVKTKSNSVTHKIPLFWGHGTYDDKVLFEQQPFGVQKLHDWGLSEIDARQYPVGHSSHPDEMKDLADFVYKCIFESDSSGDDTSGAAETTAAASSSSKNEL
jgi:predicted esterase